MKDAPPALRQSRQEWEELGTLDPFWAVLSDPHRRFGKWDVAAFLRTGDDEISRVMACGSAYGLPAGREAALDFGCGPGRLTRALARHFQTVYGVDISGSMIAKAREINDDVPNCRFVVNDAPELRAFPDASFDVIYSTLVLQHLPSQALIKGYILEFVRTLRARGLLVFQVPCSLSLRGQLSLRRRVYVLCRALGISGQSIYRRLHSSSIQLNSLPEDDVVALLRAAGATVLVVQRDDGTNPWMQSRTYYATR